MKSDQHGNQKKQSTNPWRQYKKYDGKDFCE